MKKVTKKTAYVDKSGTVWRRISFDKGSDEFEMIKPFVGTAAVYEKNCPMEHPVREITLAEECDYIYKAIPIKS